MSKDVRKEFYMNRKEIKELAKSKIKGHLWNLLWPVLLIGAIEGVLSSILAPGSTDLSNLGQMQTAQMSPTASFIMGIISLVVGIVLVAYKKYVLNFIRNGKLDYHDIIECIKEKWLNIFVAELLVGIIVTLASLLFVIPGVILAFAFAMVTYLVVDTNLSGVDAMKKSREMMKGYKMDYFVFMLSFIGWILLIPFTIGLILIWLAPYMEVAEAIYYDKLKEKQKVK